MYVKDTMHIFNNIYNITGNSMDYNHKIYGMGNKILMVCNH